MDNKHHHLSNHDLEHSTKLDIDLSSDTTEAEKLINTIWTDGFQIFDIDKSKGGKRPLTPLINQLKLLVLNLFKNWSEDPSLLLGVPMTKNGYKVKSRYNTLNISSKLIEIVNRLHVLGLIEWKKGSESAKRTTRIWPTEKLIEIFKASNLSMLDLKHTHKKEVIILNNKMPNDSKAKRMEYIDTPLIKSMRKQLVAYNQLLESTYIDVGDQESSNLITKESKHISINQHNKFVSRVFYRGSWNLGGRFHGGWWQSINSIIRSKILINDQPTVELDYSGLHVSLIYGLQQKQPPSDPYSVDLVNENFTKEEQRKCIKELVLMAINAKTLKKAFMAFRADQDARSMERSLTDKSLRELLDGFIEANALVDPYLGKDKGVELMAMDGRITAKIINHFTEKNIPILTVHDSYIINHEYSGELRKVMNDATEEELGGFKINIKQDTIGIDQYRAFTAQEPNNSEMKLQLLNSLPKVERTEEYKARYKNFRLWLSIMS